MFLLRRKFLKRSVRSALALPVITLITVNQKSRNNFPKQP
jgi:hypothetical protein